MGDLEQQWDEELRRAAAVLSQDEQRLILCGPKARDVIAASIRRHDPQRNIAAYDLDHLAGSIQADLVDLLEERSHG